MPRPVVLGLLFVAAVVGGGVNALAGGGTLITFPALTALGIPALTANVTNTVALVPGYAGGAWSQRHDLDGQRGRIVAAAAPAVVGGVLGAWLLFVSGADTFRTLVPWLILLATGLLAAEGRVKVVVQRHLAAGGRDDSGGDTRAHLVSMVVLTFIGSVYGGYFGAGLGIVLLALFAFVLPEPLNRINALKQLVSLLANGAAAVVFALARSVAWPEAAVMAVGALAGGALGGRMASRVDPGRLRAVVVVAGVVIAAVYFVK